MRRVKTGIEGLDTMLNGGFLEGRVYFVIGNTGTGKTLFALQYLLEGLKQGEKNLYISVDKVPKAVIQNVSQAFNWDLSTLDVMDAVPAHTLYATGYPIHDITTKSAITVAEKMKTAVKRGKLTIESILLKLNKEFQKTAYTRIVVDSLTILRKYSININTKNIALHQLVRFFVERNITALITVDEKLQELYAEAIEAGGMILLQKTFQKNRLVRELEILKMRGTSFDHARRRFYIDKKGIVIKI